MSESNKQSGSVITPEMQQLLAAAVTAAVEAAKKPYVSEAEQKAIEAAQEDRKVLADLKKKEMEQKRAFQRICSHLRKDGSCRAVYVENGGFLLCQRCQAVI